MQPEPLIVVRTDPLDCIEHALFHRGVDVAACNLLRDRTQLRIDLSQEAGCPDPQSLQVGRGTDLFPEPAAHLGAGVARRNLHNAELAIDLAHQVHAAAIVQPRIVLTRSHSERNARVEDNRRLLADVIEAGSVSTLDRCVLHGIEDLKRRHDFAGRRCADLESAIGQRGDPPRNHFRVAPDGVERLRKARWHAPAHRRLRVNDRRGGDGAGPRKARGRVNE